MKLALLLPIVAAAAAAAQKIAVPPGHNVIALPGFLEQDRQPPQQYVSPLCAGVVWPAYSHRRNRAAVASVPESSAPTDCISSDLHLHHQRAAVAAPRVAAKPAATLQRRRTNKAPKMEEGWTARQVVGGVAVAVLVAVI